MKQHRKNLILVAAVLALSLPWVGCKKSTVVKTTTTEPTGPVELKLKWPEGRRMVQSFALKQGNDMAIPGMAQPMKQDMTMEQKYRMTVLKDRPDGMHEVEFEFLDSHVAVKMGEKTVLDTDASKKPAAAGVSPVATAFEKMVGAKIRFLLDASNRVDRVEGVDELQKRLVSGKETDPMGVLKGMFKEEYFKQMMDHGRSLPPKAVSPGDTWPVQLEVSMGELGSMVMDYTYTLEAWQKRQDRYCARIMIEGTIKSKAAPTPNGQGMTIAIEGGTSTGEALFDLDMGMFVDTTLNQDMNMTVTIPNPARNQDPKKPKTMAVKSALKQNLRIKLDSVK